MQNTHGFIARATANKGVISYRGYDLKEKNIRKAALTIDDYEITFNTFSVERHAKLDSKTVLANLYRTTDKVFVDTLQINETAEKIDEAVSQEERVIPVNGKVIESIICQGEATRVKLRSTDLELANDAVQEMWNGLVMIQSLRRGLKLTEKQKLRKDTLDIAKEGDTEFLVHFQGENADSALPVGGSIDTRLVKQTLYYMLDLYVQDPKFLNKINVKHQTPDFEFVVEKDKLTINKLQGNFTEIELAVAKDLIKMF